MTADRIVRIIFFIIFGIIGWYVGTVIAGSSDFTLATLRWTVPAMLIGAVIGAFAAPYLSTKPARWVRRVVRQLPAQQIVAGTIGLVVGLVIAALLVLPLSRLPSPFGDILPAIGAVVFGYLGITVMVLRADDITDLVGGRWRKQPSAAKSEAKIDEPTPVLLDSSVIIDGRIADISQTGFVMGPMLIPRFVLNEVQYIADSADTMDVKNVRQVDDKLVQLAKQLHCPIVTNDFNLNQVAQLQGVKVLNINALANAVKVLVLPGEMIHVQVIDEGKEMGQGVGYLDDGTMVVVESGLRYIGREIDVQVTKVLQTNAGRMIFGQPLQDGS